MFQEFSATADASQGPARLAALRNVLKAEGVSGFLVPRADVHQGEYVAPHDERLSWLTGFTGSAGFCAALLEQAGVFIDGRYRTQVTAQVDTAHFTPVPWPETSLADWLKTTLPDGGIVAYDPWLHRVEEIETLELDLALSGISLRETDNLVDRIWADQPAPPLGAALVYPAELAGRNHAQKIEDLAADLRTSGQRHALITLPDSLCWLLNLRGSDISRNPVLHGFALLNADTSVDLFVAPEKLDATLRDHLGNQVHLHQPETLLSHLAGLEGPVRLDKRSAPMRLLRELQQNEVAIAWGQDPCILPKACKTPSEIAGSREAHLIDAAAMCEFLSWYDAQPVGTLTEIDVVRALEEKRQATGGLREISFDTISGTGPNGAVIHYRVTEGTNAPLKDGQLLVLDSGGQYLQGTTDITRTLPVGTVGPEEKACFTRVLQGMIAMSRLRFPKGLSGRDIDAVARAPLWSAGLDYDHGTGHGVGVYLCVHEGPQGLSRRHQQELLPGMILSNEPGYYRPGAFGIRIENLIVVTEAAALVGADARAMLEFETLTYVPIDLRLIEPDMLTLAERDWLNRYHRDCRDKISPRLGQTAQLWLRQATEAI